MKGLISLAVVVAFFVAIPQCFGQDACQSPAQLLEEQQPLQMSLLVMAPPPSCHRYVETWYKSSARVERIAKTAEPPRECVGKIAIASATAWIATPT